MKLEEIKEGETKIIVPQVSGKGPLSRGAIFYNPAMKFNRDVTVMLLRSLGKTRILDGLAGTGVRGCRIAKEVGGEVTINDKSKLAYQLTQHNIRLNRLSNAEATNKDLNLLLSERKFDYIDIDPYGTPVPFVDSAIRAIRENGILGVTATDKATLCGVYPNTSARRYGARVHRTPYSHELGIRVLLGYLCREAIKHDKWVKVLLSHSTAYYLRTYLMLGKGARKANLCLKKLGYVKHDFHTSERKIGDKGIGPLWISKLSDSLWLKKLRPIDGETRKHLRLWLEEADAPPLYYELPEICAMLKLPPPKLDHVLKELKAKGYVATRTHFSSTALKTNASIKEVKRSVERLVSE